MPVHKFSEHAKKAKSYGRKKPNPTTPMRPKKKKGY